MVKIRPAVPADLKQCVALDHHTTTERVWQMDRREENSGVMISFQPVRLPRSMRVHYPREPKNLWQDWRQWDAFLVADDDGYIRGYLGLLLSAAEGKGWIRDLVVGRPYRRSGIGTLLIGAVREWAAERSVSQLTLEMQSKNYPAIRFCQKQGFQFCGYNESYYPNQDIALFFVSRLH
jgi:ribosomal protein S18 acetylase RimI-like enzyme